MSTYAEELLDNWYLIVDRIKEAEALGLVTDRLWEELEHTNQLMRDADVEWVKR